jgi:AcrR family transcriptional regulator
VTAPGGHGPDGTDQVPGGAESVITGEPGVATGKLGATEERSRAGRAVGRPRSRTADAAILGATLRLLATQGYQALTIEAVAAAAGVGRPTIYRRYASKAELVAAALESLSPEDETPLPDDTRGALLTLLGLTASALGARGGMTLVGSLMAQESRDPELVSLFRTRLFAPRHEIVREVLRRGIERGEVDPGAALDVAIDLLFGSLLARGVAGEPPDEAFLAAVVDTVLAGVGPRAAPVRGARPGGGGDRAE